jgi:hypothetical protein
MNHPYSAIHEKDLTQNYRQLAAAILKRAVLDAQSTNGRAASARCWLETSEWCAYLVEALELDVRKMRRWVGELEPDKQLFFDL